jgi:hypothetical protein
MAAPDSRQSKRRRRPRRAVLDWQRKGFLRFAFFQCYAADDRFGRALIDLYNRHRNARQSLPLSGDWWWVRELAEHSGSPDVLAFIGDLEQVAATWGLACLDQGHESLYVWCRWRCEYPLHSDVSTFGTLTGFGGCVPEVGQAGRGAHEYGPVRYERSVPVARVEVVYTWHAEHETYADALQHILQQCEAQARMELSSTFPIRRRNTGCRRGVL